MIPTMIDRIRHLFPVISALVLLGCSEAEESPNSYLRKKNQKGEFLYRMHDEYLFVPPPAQHRALPVYLWNKKNPEQNSL